MCDYNLMIGIILIGFFAFFSVASFSIPFAIIIAKHLNWFDEAKRSNRKMHKGAIPFLGGAAVYFGFLLSFSIYKIFFGQFHSILEPPKWFAACVVGGFLVLALGTIDDLYDISPIKKLLAQIFISSLVYMGGVQIDHMMLPFWGLVELGFFSFPVTVLVITTVMNAVNIIDGLDGLAGGIVLVACVANLFFSLFFGLYFIALMTFVLGSCILGFLRHNWSPASIFLGDGGSLLLGYLIVIIGIQNIQISNGFAASLLPLLVLFYPVLDVIFAMTRRVIRGKPMMSSDKAHFHHFLIRKGLSSQRTVGVIIGFSAVLAISGLLFLYGNIITGFIILFLTFDVSIALLITLGYFDRELFRGYVKHRKLIKKFNAYKSYIILRCSLIENKDDVWSIMGDIADEYCLRGICWIDRDGYARSAGELPLDHMGCLVDNMGITKGSFICLFDGRFDEHVNSEIEAILKSIIMHLDKKLAKLER